MQYLLQNKVNYLNNSQSIVYVNTITNQSEDFIIYTNNDIHSFEFHWFNPNEQTGTTFDIVNAVYTYICNNIIYSIRPAFTCSNFIDITSNDTVTITLSTDNIVKEYTFPLKKQFMCCAPILVDVVHNSSKLVAVATSTIPLTRLKVPKLTGNYVNFCDVIGM